VKRIVLCLVLAALFAVASRTLQAQEEGTAGVSAVAGGEWKAEDDSPNGGNSSAHVETAEGRGNLKTAVRLDYSLGGNYEYRYAIAGLKYPGVQDRSRYKGIRFWAKGSGSKIEFDLCMNSILDYDYHGYTITETTNDWKEYILPFTTFKQSGWGKKVAFDPSLVDKIQFKSVSMKDGEEGFIVVDGIEFMTQSVFTEKIAGDNFLYADFEGMLFDKLGSEWGPENDSGSKGNSICNMKVGDGQNQSKGSLRLDYKLGPAFKFRFAIAKVDFQQPISLSGYNAVKFWLKGSGHKLKMHICAATVGDYDYHEYVINSTATDWKQYVIPLSAFKQEGWGKAVPLDLTKIRKIQFQTGSAANGEQGWFEVDNIIFSKLGK
jgi:hypothetical protein